MSVYHTPFHPSALPARRRRIEGKHARRARAAQWRKDHGGYSIGGKR